VLPMSFNVPIIFLDNNIEFPRMGPTHIIFTESKTKNWQESCRA
jgi:hypothetical protein